MNYSVPFVKISANFVVNNPCVRTVVASKCQEVKYTVLCPMSSYSLSSDQ